jgi:hypothetical protein
MNYTTYIFGAGASANSIPTINELPKAFENVSEYIEKEIEIHKRTQKGNKFFETMDYDSLKNIAIDIKKLSKLSLEYGTIDTYFKKLFLNNEKEETNQLKTAMSFFFYLWQNCQCNFEKIEGKEWRSVDLRYISLLSNILMTDKDCPKWNDKFRIITWNYDFQIIRGIQSLTSKSSKEIILDYSIYPLNKLIDNSQTKSNIIYLNGISGAYNFNKEIDFRYEENLCNPLENIFEIYKDYKEKGEERSELLNFAWELHENIISQNTVGNAKQILNNTSNLVIVGYSFPYYNYEIDKELLKWLPKNSKIYYQDFNADLEIFEEKFQIPNRPKIKIFNNEKSLQQFYLP